MPTIRNDPSPAHHDDPFDSRRHGDESRLYIAYANRLRRVLATIVNTSDANLEDACSFAWLQLVVTRPRYETVWPWLVKVAEREAWRLHRQHRRSVPIDDELDQGACG